MSDHAHAAEHGHDHGDGDGAVHAHISSLGLYVGIFLTLIALTITTVAVSYVDMGSANLLVAIVVASIKAALVVLFFMHLKYDNRFNAVMFIGSLLFIGVFFSYTMNDTDHRAQFDSAQGSRVLEATGEFAPGGLEATEKETHATEAAAEGHAGDAGPTQGHAATGAAEKHGGSEGPGPNVDHAAPPGAAEGHAGAGSAPGASGSAMPSQNHAPPAGEHP